MQSDPDAVDTPLQEKRSDRTPRLDVARQEAPRASGAQQVKNRIDASP
jgi:hypothetical protein